MINIERKILFGSVVALTIAVAILACAVAAQEETSGTVLIDDIEPYSGPIGADSPLYALKLALEDIDESFTANETERVAKQVDHGRLRLAEVRRSLELNQSDSAEEALNNYWLKMDLANLTIAKWSSNATGLLHAQEQIIRHQLVLEHLLETHPGNTGLQRAYDNSLRLEERFGEKTMIRYNRTIAKNNQTIMKAIRLAQKEYNRNGWPETTTAVTAMQTDDRQKGWEKDKGKDAERDTQVTTSPTQAPATDQQQNQGQGSQQDKNRKGSAGDKGKGGSRNN